MGQASLFSVREDNRTLWRTARLGAFEKTSFATAQGILPNGAPDWVKSFFPNTQAWAAQIVFVNGLFCPEASVFSLLSQEILQIEGPRSYALSLPSQTCLAAQPIAMLFLSQGGDVAWQSDFSFRVRLGENARATLFEKHVVAGDVAAPLVALLRREVSLAAQAKLVHAILADHGDAEKASFGHMTTSVARLEAGAYYDIFDFTMGRAAFSRHEWQVHLAQEMAQVRLLSGLLGEDEGQAQLVATIRHEAAACTSLQSSRAILSEAAQGTFYGKVFVAPLAQKTDGHQESRTLLLSDRAMMAAEPALEIYADDVKCSHGCTMGDLDETALFYLRSRGVPEAAARALLLQAFMVELIEQVPDPLLREALEPSLSANLKRLAGG